MKLKPCPHCGEKAETVSSVFFDRITYRVKCNNCRSGTDFFDLREEAESAWNRRYEPPDLAQANVNEPLTLEELREMDGEPIWIGTADNPEYGYWDIVSEVWDFFGTLILKVHGMLGVEDMGKTWNAYRRRPEEGTK